MSRTDVRIDALDLQILKILTHNCRTSYRSTGKTLGLSVNTARTRINNLISSKAIERFITLVNFSLVGYDDVLTIILKVNKNRHGVIDKVAKNLRELGPIYQHIEILDEVHVLSLAVKDIHIRNNNIDALGKNLSKALGRSTSVLDTFFGKQMSLVSEKFRLRKIDLEILGCLLSDPRMTFLNIARTLGCSQKTIIRRIEKLRSSRIIMGFSLQFNPSHMKGYNYFSVVLQTQAGCATEVMKEISYSELNEYILRLPPFIFLDRVIIIFHIENVFDIESIVSKVKSIKGVIKAETYHPIRIKWHEDWLKKEISNKILTI